MIIRDTYHQKIKSGFDFNPIVILLGTRQVGKTSLMEQYAANYSAHWMIGQDPAVAGLFEKLEVIERYLRLHLSPDLEGLLVIDEFQYIPGISVQLKLLSDKHRKLKILCSGSSSLDIIRNVEESLAGRVRVIPVYGLSFSEYLLFVRPDLQEKLSKTESGDSLNQLFPELPVLWDEYLIYGGLPKVALASREEDKIELLHDIYQTYLLKDVKQFIDQKDVVAFNRMLHVLAAQVGNLLNINELSKIIQLPYRKCEEYLYILQQMFILHLLPPYFTNRRKEITKMNKVFFCDNGLRNMVYNSFNPIHNRTEKGALFENSVYLQLLQQYKLRNLYFYRNTDGMEIDFIITRSAEDIIPVEVKFQDFQEPKNIRAIHAFQNHVPGNHAFVINRNLVSLENHPAYILPYRLAEQGLS